MALIAREELVAAREAAIDLLFAAGGLVDAAISPDCHPWEGALGPNPVSVKVAATLGKRLEIARPKIVAALPAITPHTDAREYGKAIAATSAHEAAIIFACRVWQTICKACELPDAEECPVALVREHWSRIRERLARNLAQVKGELLVHEVRAESDRATAETPRLA